MKADDGQSKVHKNNWAGRAAGKVKIAACLLVLGLYWLHRTSALISATVCWAAGPDRNIISGTQTLSPADERSSHDRVRRTVRGLISKA
jgi:hypothetical protein